MKDRLLRIGRTASLQVSRSAAGNAWSRRRYPIDRRVELRQAVESLAVSAVSIRRPVGEHRAEVMIKRPILRANRIM